MDSSGNPVTGNYTEIKYDLKRRLYEVNTYSGGVFVAQGQYDNDGITFTGYMSDEESGLFYTRFRYYDANAARFVRLDPVRDRMSSYFLDFSLHW